MVLVHEIKFLVTIIIIGIVLTMFDGGVSSGSVDSKPDECKTNPMLPVCEKYCYDLFLEQGSDGRTYYNSTWYIIEEMKLLGEEN